jgi:hypothetical protein
VQFEIGAAINDKETLRSNLMASSLLNDDDVHSLFIEDARCASIAYNNVLENTTSPYVILAHQDVYLPRGFKEDLLAGILAIERTDKNWGVLGIVGIDVMSTLQGRLWSNGLQIEVGAQIEFPMPVVSIDELLIVLRRDSGLFFDGNLPGFHLYGTDIVLTALERGLGAYVFDGPVIHNSLPVKTLKSDYEAAYRFMQRKWRHRLPLQSLIVPITRTLWPLRKRKIRALKRRFMGPKYVTQRHPDPAALAHELGYE